MWCAKRWWIRFERFLGSQPGSDKQRNSQVQCLVEQVDPCLDNNHGHRRTPFAAFAALKLIGISCPGVTGIHPLQVACRFRLTSTSNPTSIIAGMQNNSRSILRRYKLHIDLFSLVGGLGSSGNKLRSQAMPIFHPPICLSVRGQVSAIAKIRSLGQQIRGGAGRLTIDVRWLKM